MTAIKGWDRPGFDDASWERARVVPGTPNVALVPDPAEPIRVAEVMPALSCRDLDSTSVLIDFGQNLVGWVRVRLRGATGDRIVIRHGERLDEHGALYTGNLRSARQIDEYICAGDGVEVFEPSFTLHGFQYVEIHSSGDGLQVLDAEAHVVHSNLERTGHLVTANEEINQLVKNVDWTLRGNFIFVPTDCPQRDERLGWTGDGQVFARTATYYRDVEAFYLKWCRDISDAQYDNGAFPDTAPLLCFPSEGCPGWGDAGVILPWTLLTMYGNRRVVDEHWTAMRRWMEYIADGADEFIRSGHLNMAFNDWLCTGGDKTPLELVATAYWAWDAQLMAEMARATGRENEAAEFSQLRTAIGNAFVKSFVDESGIVGAGTLTGFAMAIRMGLVPAELLGAVRSRFRAAVVEADWHPIVGFIGVGYLLPALSEVGLTEDAYRVLLQTGFPLLALSGEAWRHDDVGAMGRLDG